MAPAKRSPESRPLEIRPLRVLGVDPGLADVGYGVIDWTAETSSARLVDYGVIQTAAGGALAERLDQIFAQLSDVVEQFRPDEAAVEELFFAKNVKTAMVVAHGRAACILALARRKVKLCEYTPLEIKQALTGHGRAPKEQVQWMVRAVLKLEEIPRPDHAADALAAALCHVHSLSLREKVNLARAKLSSCREPQVEDGLDARKALIAQMRTGRRRR